MGKGKRNRQIRREAREIAEEHGNPGATKHLARFYRKGVTAMRRRKHSSTPKGPTVWRPRRDAVVELDSDRADGVGGRRFRDRLSGR